MFGHTFDTTGLFGASRGSDGEMEERGFPSWMTLPAEQDLATGRRWHFFFAWLLVINGLVYVVNLVAAPPFSRSLRRALADLRALPRTVARSRASCASPRARRRFTTMCCRSSPILSVVFAFPILVLAGLTMSPAIDSAFPWLLDLFGGRQSARTVHFMPATCLVAVRRSCIW